MKKKGNINLEFQFDMGEDNYIFPPRFLIGDSYDIRRIYENKCDNENESFSYATFFDHMINIINNDKELSKYKDIFYKKSYRDNILNLMVHIIKTKRDTIDSKVFLLRYLSNLEIHKCYTEQRGKRYSKKEELLIKELVDQTNQCDLYNKLLFIKSGIKRFKKEGIFNLWTYGLLLFSLKDDICRYYDIIKTGSSRYTFLSKEYIKLKFPILEPAVVATDVTNSRGRAKNKKYLYHFYGKHSEIEPDEEELEETRNKVIKMLKSIHKYFYKFKLLPKKLFLRHNDDPHEIYFDFLTFTIFFDSLTSVNRASSMNRYDYGSNASSLYQPFDICKNALFNHSVNHIGIMFSGSLIKEPLYRILLEDFYSIIVNNQVLFNRIKNSELFDNEIYGFMDEQQKEKFIKRDLLKGSVFPTFQTGYVNQYSTFTDPIAYYNYFTFVYNNPSFLRDSYDGYYNEYNFSSKVLKKSMDNYLLKLILSNKVDVLIDDFLKEINYEAIVEKQKDANGFLSRTEYDVYSLGDSIKKSFDSMKDYISNTTGFFFTAIALIKADDNTMNNFCKGVKHVIENHTKVRITYREIYEIIIQQGILNGFYGILKENPKVKDKIVKNYLVDRDFYDEHDKVE